MPFAFLMRSIQEKLEKDGQTFGGIVTKLLQSLLTKICDITGGHTYYCTSMNCIEVEEPQTGPFKGLKTCSGTMKCWKCRRVEKW